MFLRFVIVIFLISSRALASTYDELADKSFRLYENSLTIQIIPSTYPLEWKKPRDLLFSIIKNKYFYPVTTKMIGHVTVELNCSIDGFKKREFIGQSVKDLMGFSNKIKEGYGFSILNHPRLYPSVPMVTVAGKLDKEEDIKKDINRLIPKNHFGALSFKISKEQCLNASKFIIDYKEKTRSALVAEIITALELML